LRVDSFWAPNTETMDPDDLVAVDWQLDRYGNWPARVLPKNNKTRRTRSGRRRRVRAEAISHADNGWLCQFFRRQCWRCELKPSALPPYETAGVRPAGETRWG
jgi:hypothetical protein